MLMISWENNFHVVTDAHIKRENGKFPKFFHQFSNSDLFIDVFTHVLLRSEMQTGTILRHWQILYVVPTKKQIKNKTL